MSRKKCIEIYVNVVSGSGLSPCHFRADSHYIYCRK